MNLKNRETNIFQAAEPALRVGHDPIRDGVQVPALQAVITGILAGGAVGAAIGLVGWDVSPWAVGGVVGLAVALASWKEAQNFWKWSVSESYGYLFQFLPGAPILPEPEPEPARALPPVRIELSSDNGRHQEFIDLPFPDRLPQLASGLVQGQTFSLTVWAGQNRLFSRAEFETLRDEMIRRGLLAWVSDKSRAKGVSLTAAGRAIMKRLATPTLPGGEAENE